MIRDRASSSHPIGTGDEPIRWWRPGWNDVVRHVGVGWLLLAGAGLAVSLPAAALAVLGGWTFVAASFKLLVMLVGTSLGLVGYVMRRAIQARREPFCIFCGYSLTGLPDNYRCPECGRPYTWTQIEEYRRDPQWFIERWKARETLPPADPPIEVDASRPRRRSRDGTG